MASVRKNFTYSLLLTVSGYIFQLLTYPYVSRVLGVDKIGVVSYVDGIINYFVLFSQLGIVSFGIREIAKYKDDRERLSDTFNTLFSINLFFLLISVGTLVLVTITIESLHAYKDFLLLGIIKIVFSTLLIEWLYQGVSDFRYITLRTLVVRLFYVISVFIFVRGNNDAIKYYGLSILMIVVNAIINLIHSKKIVFFSLRRVNLRIFWIPIISYGIYRLLTSLYTSFNVVFLGAVTDDTEVGYFATSTKLYVIILSVFTSFTNVMIPKVSEMLHEEKNSELSSSVNLILQMIISITSPIVCICFFFAPFIVELIAGEGYQGACLPFRIISFIIPIVALEQVFIQQFILTTNKSKYINTISLAGAFMGVSMNILLTKHMGAVGSAFSWLLSELTLLILGYVIFRKCFKFIVFNERELSKTIIYSMPYIAICSSHFLSKSYLIAIASILLSGIWFFYLNMKILKIKPMIQVKDSILLKINGHKCP